MCLHMLVCRPLMMIQIFNHFMTKGGYILFMRYITLQITPS